MAFALTAQQQKPMEKPPIKPEDGLYGKPGMGRMEHTPEDIQRRNEIMILVKAYKLLSEEKQPAVKEEIVKRMKEDFSIMRERAEKRVAAMEENLNKIKEKMAKKDDIDKRVEKEFNRLLNAPDRPMKFDAPPKHGKIDAPPPPPGPAICPMPDRPPVTKDEKVAESTPKDKAQ